jgi:hypothetical protein
VPCSRSSAERLREEGDFFLPSTFARALASAFRSGPEAPIDLQTKLATYGRTGRTSQHFPCHAVSDKAAALVAKPSAM